MGGLIRGYKKHLTVPHPGWQRTDPLDRGLIGEWRFNPATGLIVPDYSGRGLTGTVVGDPPWVSTQYGPAIDFGGNGSGDRIDLPSGVLWDSTEERTAEFFGYLNAGWADGPTPWTWQTDQATGFVMFIWDAPNYYGINFGSSANFLQWNARSEAVRDALTAAWNHIVLVYDGVDRTAVASYKLYLNGAEVAWGGSAAFGAIPNSSMLGKHSGGDYIWDGPYCLTRLYNRIVSPAEVQARYELCLKRADPMTHVWMMPWGMVTAVPRIPRPPAAYSGLMIY